MVEFGGFWNRALYHLTSSPRSGASLPESVWGAWPRFRNFTSILTPSHALLKRLFFSWVNRGGEGGGVSGGMDLCRDGRGCDFSGTSIGRSPFLTIGDTIGCFRLSQVEMSRSSEWSPAGSGPMSLSMSRRRFLISRVVTWGTASPGSSSGDWGKHTFFH